MSYEGYEVWLCEKGHEHSFDCYDTPSVEDWNCPICNSRCVWYTCVDQTNGCNPKTGRCHGEVDLEIDQEAEYEVCKTCGAKKLIREETYKIPEKKGIKVNR